MVRRITETALKGGLLPWIGLGAAVVILAFGVVAFLGTQRMTPSTGSGGGQATVSLPTASPSATPGASATASATPTARPTATASASRASQPIVAPAAAAGHRVLLDQAGISTWQSPEFVAPNTWTISYIYDCGGRGGHFTVAVFSETMQVAPIDTSGGRGSGTGTVQGGGRLTIATDTESYCTWHVTARG